MSTIKCGLIYVAFMAAIYTVIVGLCYMWVIHVDADYWKLPLVGAFNAILNIGGNKLMRQIFNGTDTTVEDK